MFVNILIEGRSDEPVAKKLLRHAGLEAGTVYGNRGKAYLKEAVREWGRSMSLA
jgi:hypothetical protein